MSDALNTEITSNKPLVLHYYPIRGVAQPIRILLHYLQIDYIDNFLNKSQENQVETGFRVGLPMLQDGDFKVSEQISIMNYLSMKANKQALLGLTPQDNAKINELFFKYSVQKKKIMSSIMQGLKYLQDQNLNKKELCQKSLKKIIEECKFIEICLKKVGKSKKYVFDYLSLIDFLFYEICFYIEGFYKQLIAKDSEYYGLVKYKYQFQKQQFYQKNKNRIQQNQLFFQFTTPSLNIMVTKLWKGSQAEKLFVKSTAVKA